MEKTTEMVNPSGERPALAPGRGACLVHIYPTGPDLGRRYPLGALPVVIGRGDGCTVRIDDHSVSRRHARVELRSDGPVAVDLESTNGTFVNDVREAVHHLSDGDYLRVGNHIYRFLTGGNIEADYHEEIHRMAIIDALTEIPNKRHLLEYLKRELARSARHNRPLTLILFDIDHFKALNDQHGHLCGDYALRELAAVVKTVIREEELFARYGGEEFAVVLPESTPEQARALGERVRALVAEHPFGYEGKSFQVTVSLGMATTTGDETLTPEELIRQADSKLYEAKRSGRNRLVA